MPGLDLRRVTPEATPFLQSFVRQYPAVDLRTLPSTELVPTLITGVWPHEHGVWQVSLDSGVSRNAATRLLGAVPDVVSTTIQCVRHLLDSSYDLAAIPWRRRRHFRQHRFKYTRRQSGDLSGPESGTLFDWVGERSRYQFTRHWSDMPRLLDSLPQEGLDLDFLEFYALDLLSHWHLDQPDIMAEHLRRLDDFAGELLGRCRHEAVTLVLLVDHGQELIRSTIDLTEPLRESGARSTDYHYFIEVGQARLWFETDEARAAVTTKLSGVPGLNLFTWEEMARFDVRFPDASFGELYAIADNGVAFFPHDFYQPLANLYLGLTSPEQRPRRRDPRHRANHGQLPDHPSERGTVVVADGAWLPTTDVGRLIDFAPTVLSMLGRAAPDHLEGKPMFAARARGE
ncbi:MAG: alkaline phosphatase family protein [Gemmatimonadota bacterium]